MIAELSGKDSRRSQKKSDGKKSGLQKRVIDSLIYKYLCDSGCDYSVGVFLPETEMTKREVQTYRANMHFLSGLSYSMVNWLLTNYLAMSCIPQ